VRLWLFSIFFVLFSGSAIATPDCEAWPLWNIFSSVHIQDDGRVIDYGAEGVSTSEGQAYALFFALVVGDKTRFDRILKWTIDNLAKGDLPKQLPAWKWGKSSSGEWKTLDENSASDADIWIAYSLLQAANQWKDKSYLNYGMAMLHNIAKQEVVNLPGAGNMLLPAPYGFSIDPTKWRLNPSYIPLQLMRYFAKVDSKGPWKAIGLNTVKMIAAVSRNGLVPDWIIFRSKKGFFVDTQSGKYTSYEAIRVYLWWAMLNKADPLFQTLGSHVTGAEQFDPTNTYIPERIDVFSGDEEGSAPVGFEAAIAAYRHVVYGSQTTSRPHLADNAGYYNHVLSIFAYGWLERRFDFNLDGSLNVGIKTCSQ
jgi:endoglucanase